MMVWQRLLASKEIPLSTTQSDRESGKHYEPLYYAFLIFMSALHFFAPLSCLTI